MLAGAYRLPKIERVVFGTPYAQALRAIADETGARRVFVIASRTLHRETPLVTDLARALGGVHAGTFDGIGAHSPRDGVVAAANAARDAGADLLVTLGGGSVTDGAKVVPLCLANGVTRPEQLDALVTRRGQPVDPRLRAPAVRAVAVPTTMSAGEFMPYAGITNPATGRKDTYFHPYAVPAYVVLDPAATLATPMRLWLSTGIRALDHVVEGYLSPKANPFSQASDLHAMRLLPSALSRCRADPSDIEARFDCQMAMWMSTVGSQGGVDKGASHAIGHVLGSRAGVPHGITSCVMLPSVLRYNLPVNRDAQATVARTMGAPDDDAAGFVEALVAGLGLPTRLSQVGIGTELFDELAALSMHDAWIATNPRPLPDAAAVREILQLAA